MLMVAATLKPHLLAGVFDHLGEECSQAAPSRPDGAWAKDPLDFIAAIRTRFGRGSDRSAVAAADRADYLIYAIGLLGEFVGGGWRWVPCWTTDGGLPDDHGPWELEYSPPSDAVQQILREMCVVNEKGNARGGVITDADLTHERIRKLAASAAEDLSQRLRGQIAGMSMAGLHEALSTDGGHLMPVHAALIAVVNEIHAATQPEADARGSWWNAAHERLENALARWLEQVPSAIPTTRNKRQQLKRDLATAFEYVSQYVLLLRANHASQELVQMIVLLKEICARLGRSLDELGSARQELQRLRSTEMESELACSRAIVEEGEERRWRQTLGEDVAVAASVITSVVGDTGQRDGWPQRRVCEAVTHRARARTQRYSESQVERALSKMQNVGLALRLPARALRPAGSAPRTGGRCRPHVGRVWWFNPLGAILAAPAR
jgi:hypothetical protein